MATTRIEMEGMALLKRLIDRPTTTLAWWIVQPQDSGTLSVCAPSDSWLVVSGIEASADDAEAAETAARLGRLVVGDMFRGIFGWELCKTVPVPPRQDFHISLYDLRIRCPVRIALLGWVVSKEEYGECMPEART